MGKLIFEGPKPYEITLRKEPTSDVEGEIVVSILPISLPDTPIYEPEIRLRMTIHEASHLEATIHAAIVRARVNLRLGEK